MENGIISSFEAHKEEKLICVFEYMIPGIIWDEHNIVFMSKNEEVVSAYHYIHDDKEETDEIWAIYDFFQEQGINIRETPINVVPPPFFSRVLFPLKDQGKPFYIPKHPDNIVERIVNFIFGREEIMLNRNLSFTEKIKYIYLKKWQVDPILLYHPVRNSGYEWELDTNW